MHQVPTNEAPRIKSQSTVNEKNAQILQENAKQRWLQRARICFSFATHLGRRNNPTGKPYRSGQSDRHDFRIGANAPDIRVPLIRFMTLG
jgi:hypothetical protein